MRRTHSAARRIPAAARMALGLAAGLALAAVLAGCGGSDATTTATMTPATTPTPTYAWIQANVFDASCTRCHSGPGASQGLRLDAANAPSIVGRASTEQPALLLVKPGDPDNSYLVQKLEGVAPNIGARMPFGGPYLDTTTIGAIRDWIAAGAAIP
jgi:hypothetical protein